MSSQVESKSNELGEPKSTARSQVVQVTRVWCFLMLATLFAFAIGGAGSMGIWGALVTVGLLIAKSQLIVDYFMELRSVPRPWRLLMSGYSVIIGSLILLAYWLGLS
ncbi:cytochrome C oxidase subunit IV family protein [Aestuariirhabdus sp. Z084]|uniref:cytochrome C oxidase subunit IV family protein n=1 Tax=Aestuariirhabdus haliotis TaxID=2918751 RepID=UPI00201B41A7|nr:cytochrome C oxidase subunit IV family protein [Aestuariirhabdus haliotis]MCL6416951.1 cytochrome C oxidase subunit IV family protein [Aestuariirhabdus haliotis]MCL6420946.1 cytochrome C oxidase subunit IV family protein [Aestuariirhabdus haliotis]